MSLSACLKYLSLPITVSLLSLGIFFSQGYKDNNFMYSIFDNLFGLASGQKNDDQKLAL